MRDAQTFGERAVLAFEAAWDGETAELDAQLEALDNDHLRSFAETCDKAWRRSRALWVARTKQPENAP